MEEKIIVQNESIAELLGYVYHHEGVLIDDSDIGGIYTKKPVYSKVPIETTEPNEGDVYFKNVTNPDFKNEVNPKWRSDKEFLCWSTVNYGQYLTDLNYHKSFNSIMEVVVFIEKLGYVSTIERMNFASFEEHRVWFNEIGTLREAASGARHEDKLTAIYEAVVDFIEWYNTKKR